MYVHCYYWEIESLVTKGNIIWMVDMKNKQVYCINDLTYPKAIQLIQNVEEEPNRYTIWFDELTEEDK